MNAYLRYTYCLACLFFSTFASANNPIAIKAVVLVNFEIGDDTGDTAGEFQHWMERGINGDQPLQCIDLPFSTHAACLDESQSVLVTFTGLTADKAAASVMASKTISC